MQIVSLGDNLHEISKPIFWEKLRKNIINLYSAEFAQNMLVLINGFVDGYLG